MATMLVTPVTDLKESYFSAFTLILFSIVDYLLDLSFEDIGNFRTDCSRLNVVEDSGGRLVLVQGRKRSWLIDRPNQKTHCC